MQQNETNRHLRHVNVHLALGRVCPILPAHIDILYVELECEHAQVKMAQYGPFLIRLSWRAGLGAGQRIRVRAGAPFRQ